MEMLCSEISNIHRLRCEPNLEGTPPPNPCFQADAETLGAVYPVRESAPGESGGSGPAGQAAAIRPPAEADGGGGHAAPVLL